MSFRLSRVSGAKSDTSPAVRDGRSFVLNRLMWPKPLTPEVKESLGALNKASGFLRGQVGRAMKLRVMPQLRFHFDTLQGYSRKMDNLIREAVGDKPAVSSDDNAADDPERDA